MNNMYNENVYDDDERPLSIDDSAKLIIPMHRVIDRDGNPYYIGKLQFPGVIDLGEGASIMLFTSEEGAEELQIGILDPRKRSGKVRKTSRGSVGGTEGKIRIDLHAVKDSKGRTFYIGEVVAPVIIGCKRKGIFFSAFTAQPGVEEIQISALKHKKKIERDSEPRNEPVEYDDYNSSENESSDRETA